MLHQGIHPKVVQARLGHSQIRVALDIYSYVLSSLQDEAAAKLDSLLCGAAVEAHYGGEHTPRFTAKFRREGLAQGQPFGVFATVSTSIPLVGWAQAE